VHVLVVGCGYVGTALGVHLAEAGHDVTGIRRDASGLPGAIRGLDADLEGPGLGDRLAPLRRIDAVAITLSADTRDPAAYRRAYVDAPRRLLRHLVARRDPVGRVVFTSSSAVYGQAGGAWVDEGSPTVPTSATGRVLLQAERTVAAGPFPVTVLRLTGIYGPGRTRLLEQVRAGTATAPAETTYTNRIHRDDAAAALAHVLAVRAPAPVYAVSDDDPAPRAEVLAWLAERLGAPSPRIGGPDRRRGNKRVSNARLHAAGWAPRYRSYREGYDAMLE
jgi:nucleoside-diphosphate-sugar epimerase